MLVLEGAETVGGGTRSAELTLPGFTHDVCSAIHPLGVASPFFRTLPLAEHGLEWIHPPAALAHPFDDGTAALLERSVEATGATLGDDAARYRKLMAPLARDADALLEDVLAPVGVPRHPFALARFAPRAALPGSGARQVGLPRRAGSRPVRRPRRPLDAAADAVAERRVRARARAARPRGRLAARPRRLAADRRRARLAPPLARRRDRDRPPGALARRAGRCTRGPPRRDAPPVRRDRRRPAPGPLPPPARGLPLRPRRLQARLGARRADPVAGRGVRARRPSTSAARWRRSRPPSGRRGGVRPPSGRTSCSPSRASSTRPARRRASTPPGPTATSRTARPST